MGDGEGLPEVIALPAPALEPEMPPMLPMGLSVPLLVTLGDAPRESVAVGEGEAVLVPLLVPLAVAVPVAGGVPGALLVTEGDAPRDRVWVGEAVTVGAGLPVEEGVSGGVAVGVCVPVAVAVALTVRGGVGLTLSKVDGV